MKIFYQDGVWMVDDGQGNVFPMSEAYPEFAALLAPYTDLTLDDATLEALKAQAGGQPTAGQAQPEEAPSWWERVLGLPGRVMGIPEKPRTTPQPTGVLPARGGAPQGRGPTAPTYKTWEEAEANKPQGYTTVPSSNGSTWTYRLTGAEQAPAPATGVYATWEEAARRLQELGYEQTYEPVYSPQQDAFIIQKRATPQEKVPPTFQQEWMRLQQEGKIDEANALFDQWNRMTPAEQAQVRQADQRIRLDALQVGLDIAQSPGDYVAYMQMLRGAQEPPQGVAGERVVPFSQPLQDAMRGFEALPGLPAPGQPLSPFAAQQEREAEFMRQQAINTGFLPSPASQPLEPFGAGRNALNPTGAPPPGATVSRPGMTPDDIARANIEASAPFRSAGLSAAAGTSFPEAPAASLTTLPPGGQGITRRPLNPITGPAGVPESLLYSIQGAPGNRSAAQRVPQQPTGGLLAGLSGGQPVPSLGQLFGPILNPTREPRSLANLTGVGFLSPQQTNLLTPTEQRLRQGVVGVSGVPWEDFRTQELLNSGLFSPGVGGGLSPVTQSLSRITPRARRAR